MIRIFLITVCLTLLFFPLWGQKKGTVTVHSSAQIDELMEKYRQITTENPGFNGYRILIFSASGNHSKQMAIDAKTNFDTQYPDIESNIIFEEPNYKVRVGNFRTPLETEAHLNKIISTYPNAFSVPDFIEFPKLANENTDDEAINADDGK